MNILYNLHWKFTLLGPRNTILDLEDNFLKADDFYFGIPIQSKLVSKMTRHIKTHLCGAQMCMNNYIFILLSEIILLYLFLFQHNSTMLSELTPKKK